MTTFEKIYDEELDYILGALSRLGIPRRNREDQAHEVFMVIHRKLDTYDRERPLRPWLFGICFRVASEYRRRARNVREMLTEPTPPDRNATSHQQLQAKQARKIVGQAIQAINIERRAVFVLHELDEYTIPEVAEGLSIPLNTAYSRLRLAREDFERAARKILDRSSKEETA